PLAAILPHQLGELRGIEIRRIHFLECFTIALLPMSDEIAVKPARPAHPAFEEAHLQSRKPARYAAHENRLAHRLARGCEMADVVVYEIGGRHAKTDSSRARMKRRRHSQLNALRPNRIIIVLAVEA